MCMCNRVYIEEDSNHVRKLYITTIQNQDAGTYSCKANVAGDKAEKKVVLYLFSKRTSVTASL